MRRSQKWHHKTIRELAAHGSSAASANPLRSLTIETHEGSVTTLVGGGDPCQVYVIPAALLLGISFVIAPGRTAPYASNTDALLLLAGSPPPEALLVDVVAAQLAEYHNILGQGVTFQERNHSFSSCTQAGNNTRHNGRFISGDGRGLLLAVALHDMPQL